MEKKMVRRRLRAWMQSTRNERRTKKKHEELFTMFTIAIASELPAPFNIVARLWKRMIYAYARIIQHHSRTCYRKYKNSCNATAFVHLNDFRVGVQCCHTISITCVQSQRTFEYPTAVTTRQMYVTVVEAMRTKLKRIEKQSFVFNLCLKKKKSNSICDVMNRTRSLSIHYAFI